MKSFDTIKIRRFHLSDLTSVIAILQNAFPDAHEFSGLTSSNIKRILYLQFKYGKLSVIMRSLKFLFANTYDQAVFIAEEGSKNMVVGVAIVSPITRDVWSLGQIAVLPGHCGKSIGSQLMKKVISHVRSKEGEKIQLYVRTNNASAIKLYTKLGFAIADQLNLMTIDL